MLNVIHRYTYILYLCILFNVFEYIFFSEKDSVGFTSLSKGSMAQKRLRISGLNIAAWLSVSRFVWMVWLGVW